MALWVLMRQYGFILDLWLMPAIISIPWGYIVFEPLLALRSETRDLIYLSQGRRDHPTRLLYGIIRCSPVLFPMVEGRNAVAACSCTPIRQCWGSSTVRSGAQRKLHLNARSINWKKPTPTKHLCCKGPIIILYYKYVHYELKTD